MKGKHLVWDHDLSTEEIRKIFKTAEKLKRDHKIGKNEPLLAGRTLAMIFEKPSTRTRVSFEAGIAQLGGCALYLSPKDLQLGRGETIADTARTISRYVDAIMARTYSHQTILELAKNSTVPVINGLSDLVHPCQALTDFFTIYEKCGKLESLKLAYVGDGNNVAHSLMLTASRLGCYITVASPPGYEPKPEITELARANARSTGARIEITNDPVSAVREAHVVYTDVWTSMGQEDEQERRLKVFRDYQINATLMRKADPSAYFMHCLPAHRGEEVTDEVIDGRQSIVFDQAENRMHVQKAIMVLIMR